MTRVPLIEASIGGIFLQYRLKRDACGYTGYEKTVPLCKKGMRIPMRHQNPIRRAWLFALLALVLQALVLLTTACNHGGETSSDTSVSGDSAAESVFVPAESSSTESPPAESSLPESEPSESSEADPDSSSDPGSDLTSLPEEIESSDPPAQEVLGETFCYVALGDSICRGYGLEDPETQRYSSLIGEQTGCTVYNYGVDGQTGSELVTFLQDGKAEALSRADVVSVSIGGNNLLHALAYLLRDLLAKFDPKNPKEILQADGEDLLIAVDEALASFDEELPELLELIGKQAPNAKILFQTVYNPYRSFFLLPVRLNGRLTTFSALTDDCVGRLNEKIRDGALQYGYTVCDVYDAFEQNADQLVNASLRKFNFDPHPNAAGHAVIAEVLLKEMPKKN